MGHFQGDAEVYRPKTEVTTLRQSDPIPALEATLRSRGLLDEALATEVRKRVEQTVGEAFAFARNSAYPNAREALEHVFA